MTFWAQLDNENKIIQVTIGDDNLEDAHHWLIKNHGGVWKIMPEDNYGGIGWTFIENVGFCAPRPYDSWTLNGLIWQAPTPKPEGDYYWNETELAWMPVDVS